MTLFPDYSNENKIRNTAGEQIQTQSFDAGTNIYKHILFNNNSK